MNPTPKEGEARLPFPAGKDRLRALLEAALFAAPEPVRLSALVRALGRSAEYLEELLEEWAAELERDHHGLQLRLVAGGYQLITKPEHHAELQQLFADLPEPTPLSRAAIETAAAIALQQPVTAAEIQAVRGIRNSDTIRTLLKRKLIAPAGRAPTRGHPLRYRTTEKFLREFGLKSLEELRSASALVHQPEHIVEPPEKDDTGHQRSLIPGLS
jgi:segregation and condensation protein B